MSHKILKHAAITAILLFLLAAFPVLTTFDIGGAASADDAVSSASLVLPDEPSGDFVVLMNTALHADTIGDWETFFTHEDFVVIFEDIQCITAAGDAAGQQMAERFQAELPENQMLLRTEDGTLLASKIEAGYFDTAVLSAEMAELLGIPAEDTDIVTAIRVTGGND